MGVPPDHILELIDLLLMGWVPADAHGEAELTHNKLALSQAEHLGGDFYHSQTGANTFVSVTAMRSRNRVAKIKSRI